MARWRAVVAVALLLAAVAAVGPDPRTVRAGSTIAWTYPGSCNTTTLQACIDNANSGDVVLVATNGPIHEDVTISKSLTLAAETGFSPVIDSAKIEKDTGADAIFDTVSHLNFAHDLTVYLYAGSGHVIMIDHVNARGSNSSPAIYANTYVASTIYVSSSLAISTGIYGGIDLTASIGSGPVTFKIVGNRVSAHGDGASPSGIFVSMTDVPSARADIYNNVIWDVAQSTSASNPAGLSIDVRDSGNTDINVVGNTFNRIHADGVRVVNEQMSPNRLVVNLFNNIFAGTRLAAIRLTSDTLSTLTIRAGNNDFFSNGAPNHLEGHSLGSGNLHVKPGFTSPPSGDVSLKPASPVINKGVVCSPGGIADPDIAGNHRLAGPKVDMGAFEYGATVPNGWVLVGTAGTDSLTGTGGADILCGYGGADQLYGGGGADYADGGAGADQVTGGPGPDRLFGGPGGDLICALDGHGNDHLDGGAGHDLYAADHGDVRKNVEQAGACLV